MISITVKTLDSQNHIFSVDDDMTVRQFKEQIEEKTNIAVDSQRLIYCGRVLVDEKLLREYDVNGKVVHLVQRVPPSARPNNSERSANSEGNATNAGNNVNVRGAPIFRAIDGMVLGAMAIPVNANSGQPQAAAPSLNPSSTLCMNRITVARYMLECANNIAAYLEDPSRGLNNTAMDILAQQTMESTVLEVGISAVSDIEIPQQQMQNLVQAFQGAVSAAFRQNGISNIRVMQQGNDPNSVQMVASDEPIGTSSSTGSSSLSAASQTPVSQQQPQHSTATPGEGSQSSGSSNQNRGTSPSTPNGRQQTTSTQTLAEVVQQMRNVNVRLEPFIQQYYEILLNDPSFAETETDRRESSQRVFDRVSEALHYMSHAQHAISDLMLDLSTSNPRHLCCRPILVEQSAFVSSGIALPNPVIPLTQMYRSAGLNGNNNDTSGNLNNNNQPPTANLAGSQQQSGGGGQQHSNPLQPGGVRQVNTPPVQVARLIQAVMNSAPHADVHVEISNMPNNQTTATNNTTESNSTDEGQTPPNLPPRVTTATHPTTSTQTRSTSRPQVHLTNLQDGPVRNYLRPVPANMLSAFDRFLPCNSHHIRDNVTNDQQSQQGIPIGVNLRNRPSQRPVDRISVTRPMRAQSDSRLESQRLSSGDNRSQLENEFSNLGVIYNIPMRVFGEQQFSIRQLLNATPQILNSFRSSFLSHLQTTFFNGSPITDENMTRGVELGLSMIERYLQPLTAMDLPDYDSRRSIENLIRDFLPSVFTLARDDTSTGFGTRLLRQANTFFHRVFTILVTSIGRENLREYCNQVLQTALNANHLSETHRGIFMSLVNRNIDQITTDLSEVREFLVIRRPAPGENMENLLESNTHSNVNAVQPMETDETAESPRSMNVDNEEVVLSSIISRDQLIQPPPTLEDDEILPSVVIGSEPWHIDFPTSSWIPVITRDMARQRRLNQQPAFSDAYMSGMSSKRRKIISEHKPATDIPNLLSEGVRNAIQIVGLGSNTAASSVDEIANAISTDPIVQTSYKEALKSSIQDRLQSDSDYSSERFPSTSKFFSK